MFLLYDIYIKIIIIITIIICSILRLLYNILQKHEIVALLCNSNFINPLNTELNPICQ